MAESLGRAVFDVLLDTSAFKAGIEQVRSLATRAGSSIEQALGAKASKGSLAALDIRITSLKEEIRLVEIGSAKYKELQNAIRLATQERNKAEAGTGGGFGGALKGAAGDLLAITGATAGVAGLALGIKGAVSAAIEFESVTRKLQNTLGSGGAADALQFTKGLADQLGLSYRQLSSDFGSFTAAASSAGIPLKDQEAVFAAVAKAGQSLGLSNDAVSGSLLALQQIASKGTVQMEELRGQLGERLPIALAAAAKGLGINQQELNKLVESGQLTASQFFPAIAKGLNELTASSGVSLTASQQLAILGNNWEELQRKLGETVLPTVVGGVESLAAALKFAADNTKILVQILAGVGSATAAFYLLAKASQAVASAQKAIAVAAAIAQTILNPANAAKVAIALGVGAATAVAVGKALDDAAGQQAKLGAETDRTKKKQIDANAAALQAAAAQKQAETANRNAKLTSLGVDKQNLQAQEARLGLYAQETQLLTQINAVRNQGAVDRSKTISSLLDQELQQAQAMAATDGQRRELELEYGQAKFNQTVAEFDLKARALVAEQQGQQASLAFEQQKAAAAGQRLEIEAKINLLKAQQAYADKGTPETQRQVELAQQNLDLIQKQNSEEASLGNLRTRLLNEQQAAQRDRLADERLLALNGQKQYATAEQRRQVEADTNQQLRERAGYADAAAVSAGNFREQLQGASQARGELSTAFQAQVNTVIDGSQQFNQMNTYLSQIVTNTAKPPTVNVTVNNSGSSGNSSRAVVSGTSG